MNKNTVTTLTALMLIVGFLAGGWAYKNNKGEELQQLHQYNRELFEPAGAVTIGEETAKVTIVEFFDPACETCAGFFPYTEQLAQGQPGKVRIVLRYAPFHPGSDQVVAMLEASRGQDKFFETLKIMFESQRYWATHSGPDMDLLWSNLEKGGIDIAAVKAGMNDPAIAARIDTDLKAAASLGVTMTPEYFVNGRPLPQFGKSELRALVEDEVAVQYGGGR